MMQKSSFVLTNPSGERIAGDVRYREASGSNPVVVILHSFMAFKDWGWFPFAAEKIAAEGFTAVTFNFSRNGVRENPHRITEYAGFQNNTISHELEDARVVLDAIKKNILGETIFDSVDVVLLGHSRGGGEAVLLAAERDEVKGLVTWSSVCTFDRWTPHQKEQWKKLGYLPLARDSAMSPLKLGLDLLNDVENNQGKLDIITTASKLHCPWLLIHGTEDLLVKFSEAEQLFAVADKTKTEFVSMKRVGHTYDGAEMTQDSAIHRIVELTVRWLKKVFPNTNKEYV
jgi:pimeloyl-ACP methyl ester carboxylesterase